MAGLLEGDFPVDLGASVIGTRNEGKFHVICFDFLPERIDDSKKGELYIDTDHSVELTYVSKQEEEKLVFRGRYKPSKQCMETSAANSGKKAIKSSKQTLDCILIFNEDTGRFTLECVQGMTNLKFQRKADSQQSRNSGGNTAARESPRSCDKRLRAAPVTPTRPLLNENNNRAKRTKHRTEGSNSSSTTPISEPSPAPSQCLSHGNTNNGNTGDNRSSEQETLGILSNSTLSTSTMHSPSIRASETSSSSSSSSSSKSSSSASSGTDFTEGTTLASTHSSTSSAVSSPNCSNGSHQCHLTGVQVVSPPPVAPAAGALLGMNGKTRTLDEQEYDSSDSDEFFS